MIDLRGFLDVIDQALVQAESMGNVVDIQQLVRMREVKNMWEMRETQIQDEHIFKRKNEIKDLLSTVDRSLTLLSKGEYDQTQILEFQKIRVLAQSFNYLLDTSA